MERVNTVLEANNVSPELDVRAEQFLAGRPRRHYEDRAPEQLTKDVNKLTDLLILVIRERDVLIAQSRINSLYTRILTGVVFVSFSLIAWFATQLFERLK